LKRDCVRYFIELGLTQAMDFLPIGRSFFANQAKNDLHKEGSTMLPQAKTL
jgi:hypothetical protein